MVTHNQEALQYRDSRDGKISAAESGGGRVVSETKGAGGHHCKWHSRIGLLPKDPGQQAEGKE